mmetsp:Transcript_70046/g.210451  ORF Transcript_70046/g.210451 Transcript_70046/m.210451 type:complete len:1272 (-) Transcript_70046:33-3848(-)
MLELPVALLELKCQQVCLLTDSRARRGLSIEDVSVLEGGINLAGSHQSHQGLRARLIELKDSRARPICGDCSVIEELAAVCCDGWRARLQHQVTAMARGWTRVLNMETALVERADLPVSLSQLPWLKTLALARNKLCHFPRAVCSLTALEELDVASNQLTELPESVAALKSLRRLSLWNNRFSRLPEAVGWLTALEQLDARLNQLTQLPEWVSRLRSLKVLELHGNMLSRLPETLGELTALEWLDVGENKLTELPESIWRLESIKELHLRFNKLLRLPVTIGSLVALQILNVYGNQLTELPEGVSRLPALTELTAGENPLQLPPSVVAVQGIVSVRRFFSDMRRHGRAVSRRVKTVLCGQGMAGKTSLWRGLQRGQPSPTMDKDRTIQLELSPLTLGEDAEAVVLTGWDLAGQPSYDAAQQPYQVGNALFLLCVPARESGQGMYDGEEYEQAVGRWFDGLQARVPGAVVQVVLTHADRLVSAEVREACETARREFTATHHTDSWRQQSISSEWRAAAKKLEAALSLLRPLLTPDALARAAETQLDWLRGCIRTHREVYLKRHTAYAMATHCSAGGQAPNQAPMPLRVQESIPCVCSVDGGENTLEALRAQLEALVKQQGPPLLPSACHHVPNNWLSAMELVRAVRDGRVPLAAARAALFPDTEVLASDAAMMKPRRGGGSACQYVRQDELRDMWLREVAPKVLPNEPDVATILWSAINLLVDQGEIFVSGGLVYLDLSFAVDIVRALVDHRLTDHPLDDIMAYVSSSPALMQDQQAVEKLKVAFDSMVSSGIVTHELLGFLWRSVDLQLADYEAALAMLHDSGLLVEACAEAGTSSQAASRRWVMPMRLPCEQPPVVAKRWGAAAPAEGEQLLKVAYRFYGAMPADVPHRVVAGCHTLTHAKVVACWRRGALMIRQSVKALVCVQNEQVVIEARATARDIAQVLWSFIVPLLDVVTWISRDFPGLQCGCSLACPGCLRAGHDPPFAWDQFDVHAVHEMDFWCERCETDITVPTPSMASLEPGAKRQRVTESKLVARSPTLLQQRLPPPIPQQVELLIFTCSPRLAPIKEADDEAARVSRHCSARIQRGGTPSDLRNMMLDRPTRRFLFVGHADAGMTSLEKTLGFTSPVGGLVAVNNSSLASLLGSHSPRSGGLLDLVFLNGCCSEELGQAILAMGVPAIVCWKTRLLSEAGPVFSEAFFQALAQGRNYMQAFEQAKQAVTLVTRRGTLAVGRHPCDVPRYELRDPDANPPRESVIDPAPEAVGVPVLLLA